MTEKDIKKLVKALDAINGDPESAHVEADDLLAQAVPEQVRDAYRRVQVRCEFRYA